MAALLIILALLAALVLTCVKLINALGAGFLVWCGWLGVVLFIAACLVERVGAWRTRP